MANFLIDNNTIYTYDTLLKDIIKAKIYYPKYRADNLYNYFLNLIIALVSHKPLMLIDSDFNESEINRLEEGPVNVPSSIEHINATTIDAIIKCIQTSTSEISIFTSGTTGQPKRVIHTVNTLTRSVRVSEHYTNQIWAFAYNPTHMAGLQVFFQGFENISTLINVFNKTRQEIHEAINKYSITHISATPTFYRLLLPFENSFESVKRVTFGGEKLDRKLHDFVLQIFPNAKINNIYASTEAGSLFAAKGENFQMQKALLNKVKIEEDELLIHKSLLGKSDSFIYTGEYYKTGDLIEWINKEEMLFRFKGRKNELINIGGYKVNPSEVESVILKIPDVLQAKVYGRTNSILGNLLVAELKLVEYSKLTEILIRNYLSEKLQDYKVPRIIKFVDSFLLTSSGKIKRL